MATAVAGRRRTGGTEVLVDVEHHGRTGDGPGLSRTVGWLTCLHPVRLDAGRDAARNPGRALKRVKEQLRAIPGDGLGHGLLRRMNPGTARRFEGLAGPEIGFNYLGRSPEPGAVAEPWQPAAEWEAVPPGVNPRMPFAHALEITAHTHDTPHGPRLGISLTWPAGLLAEDAVRALGEDWLAALRTLAAHGADPDAGGLTPSDVAPAPVDQEALDRLAAAAAPHGLDDVLPATPLQEGLLFHARYDRTAPDVHHIQLVAELSGALDAGRLRRACAALLDRHQALRAGFTLTAAGHVVQPVPRAVDLPWAELDLRGRGAAEREAFLAADRTRRFDPARPPLLRCTLLRHPADRHELVLTLHHLLADGWSLPVLLRDLLALYERDGDPAHEAEGAAALPPAPSPRGYHLWLAAQDREAAAAAWRAELAGLDGPTLVAPGADSGGLPTLPRRLTAELPARLTAELTGRARDLGLTVSTVVQGAWALLLAELTGRRDVVFGSTVSVRPPELPGVEEMVGLQIATVPVRVRAAHEDGLAALLRTLQDHRTDLAAHAHLGAAGIQRAVGAGPLYDTSTVFENYPADLAGQPAAAAGPRLTALTGVDAYHYPLKLTAGPGERLFLAVDHRPEAVPEHLARYALRRLQELCAAFAADPHQRIGGLLDAGAPQVPAAPPAPVAGGHEASPVVADLVAALCAEVLGLRRLDARADFFAAGGDSLTALRLVGRFGEVFGAAPDVRTVFRHRTPARIAARLAVPVDRGTGRPVAVSGETPR
ncbi:condensation domain-containing protein [Streptomyces sp. NPDC004561]